MSICATPASATSMWVWGSGFGMLGVLPPRIRPLYQAIKPGITRLVWPEPPRNIFIAKKDDDDVLSSAREFLTHLNATYPLNILSEPQTRTDLGLPFVHAVENDKQIEKYTDLVVTMGGDGTILHAMKLLCAQSLNMPPVLSFSMGTLGFLLPFQYSDAPQTFDEVYNSNAHVTKRSRLRVTMPRTNDVLHALNEVSIYRGGSPHLAELDISVNGQHLTTAIADGVNVSTPSGSTAYSLSAGGSIVHPGVECILLTPICPRSLSFRPLLVPQDAHVFISMAHKARGPSNLSLDGCNNGNLEVGDTVTMEVRSDEGVWCVSRGSDTDDWVGHINGLLGFNSKFGKL